jgi:hypothetical protein
MKCIFTRWLQMSEFQDEVKGNGKENILSILIVAMLRLDLQLHL